ncbi:MAG: DUF211 domain-containing protein [Halobacteriales archaeon]|nr:DUF211 domain-containing protein [Halobacteriales archaeon]
MTPPLRRLVVDVLKPHQPEITEFAEAVADTDGVEGVNATLIETDREVQNIKITVEGDDIDRDEVVEAVERLGGSVHSFDEVVCGERTVERRDTPQDA